MKRIFSIGYDNASENTKRIVELQQLCQPTLGEIFFFHIVFFILFVYLFICLVNNNISHDILFVVLLTLCFVLHRFTFLGIGFMI